MLTLIAWVIAGCLVSGLFGRIAYEMEDSRETLGSLSDRADPQAQTFSSLECQQYGVTHGR